MASSGKKKQDKQKLSHPSHLLSTSSLSRDLHRRTRVPPISTTIVKSDGGWQNVLFLYHQIQQHAQGRPPGSYPIPSNHFEIRSDFRMLYTHMRIPRRTRQTHWYTLPPSAPHNSIDTILESVCVVLFHPHSNKKWGRMADSWEKENEEEQEGIWFHFI